MSEQTKPNFDKLNPNDWQKYYEEVANSLANQVATLGYIDKVVFINGFAILQIIRDDIKLFGNFSSLEKISDSHLDKANERRAQLLGKIQFELNCKHLPNFLTRRLEEERKFIEMNQWSTPLNLWESKQRYQSFSDFINSKKSYRELSTPYHYALLAEKALLRKAFGKQK